MHAPRGFSTHTHSCALDSTCIANEETKLLFMRIYHSLLPWKRRNGCKCVCERERERERERDGGLKSLISRWRQTFRPLLLFLSQGPPTPPYDNLFTRWLLSESLTLSALWISHLICLGDSFVFMIFLTPTHLTSGSQFMWKFTKLLLRCGTRPYERGTQWDSNSLV